MNIEDKQVFTEKKDFPLSTLREMVDDGDIIPNPEYQRDYVYTDKQASKLVESVLMGIPIPTIYLCVEEDNTYSVIDGQQRITSLIRYLKNEYALNGLQELNELNGKYYKDLPKDIQKKLKSSSLSTISLLKQSTNLKYEIFARLNQGAVKLNPQELRNCIYRGTFNKMLDDIAATNPHLHILFHDDNNRKSYQERILRFFALRNYQDYKSSMLKTMNSYMEQHRNDGEDEIKIAKDKFNSTIDIIKQVLGDDAFMAFDRNKNKILEKFSGSVYDSIIIPFSFFDKHSLIVNADKIREAVMKVKMEDESYREDTYAATGSKVRVIRRIQTIYNLILNITGDSFSDNDRRLFTAEEKKKLYESGDKKCAICGNLILSIDDCEIDHIIPFTKGGKTELSNAQIAHRICNREKSDSTNDTWEEEEN